MWFYFNGHGEIDWDFDDVPGGAHDSARLIKGAIREALVKFGLVNIDLAVEPDTRDNPGSEPRLDQKALEAREWKFKDKPKVSAELEDLAVELLAKAVERCGEGQPRELRHVHLERLFATGSSFVFWLCREFGIDPHEELGERRCGSRTCPECNR